MSEAPKAPTRLAKVTPQELGQLETNTATEREWYKNHARFVSNEYIAISARRGHLTFIAPDSNSVPVARFRNPDKHHVYPPYLLPGSAIALSAIGRLWRSRLIDAGFQRPDLRLATTSFVRSVEYQDDLIASGALASRDSTHCVGAAFDIDASGYYSFTPDAGLQSIGHPDRARYVAAVAADLGDRQPTNPFATKSSTEAYDAAVTDVLLFAAEELFSKGMLNRIVEFRDTHNQCVHISPNPEVATQDWRAVAAEATTSVWLG